MKIIHLLETFEVGGAEVLVAALTRLQREQGHDVSVHCLYRSGPLAKEVEAAGGRVVLHGGGSRLTLMGSLMRAFRQEAPDVLHCHNATATILGAPAARWCGVGSVISTRHGLVAPPYNLKRELQYALASRFCRKIVGVCQATSENLRGAPLAAKDKIATVYNGVAAPAASMVAAAGTGAFICVQVGRLAEPKDPFTLLRAVSLARTQVADLQLWVVGDGPLRPSVEELSRSLGLESCVTFWGQRRDVPALLAKANAFVLASKSEGLPVSLLEALAIGLPVVVSAVGAMPEIVQLSGAGRSVPPEEPEAFAQALIDLGAGREQWPQLRARAIKCYQDRFTLEHMNCEYMSLYGPSVA